MLGHDAHSVDDGPLHVAQLESQLWQESSESGYFPLPQLETHVVPSLYGVPEPHEMQSEAPPALQVAHVESHGWQLALLSP